ncbi:ComEA family DNA-binding protein [Specibacter cremeus]|uniref:ComEA family DNA-binding protein n=1 Tax=Specibacter cremeus TaxID=1629051 RepID=UPI000F78BE2B|nr:ComEA family DNA-binding protein [Specibacter cremeus]
MARHSWNDTSPEPSRAPAARPDSGRAGVGGPVPVAAPCSEPAGSPAAGDSGDAGGAGLLPASGMYTAATWPAPAVPAGGVLPRLRVLVSLKALIVVLAMLTVATGVLWLQSAGIRFASAQVSAGESPKVAIPGPVPRGSSAGDSPRGPDPPASPSPVPAGADAAVLTVHVVGEVKRPGVVRLRQGSRVLDAVAAAGGAGANAALQAVNLAAVLRDGEQVVVPSNAQVGSGAVPTFAPVEGPAGSSGAGGAGQANGGKANGGRVNINTATAAELGTLPRIGAVLANRIIQWRTDHGPFTTIDQLDAVPGIGSKLLDSLRDLVVV